jgi:tRNA(fMet)-specific endonuclease VapC
VYLLDTDTCIFALNNSAGIVARRLLASSPRDVKLCSVVKAELYFGARHSQRVGENLNLLRDFFAPMESLPFDDRCAEDYGAIRADLARQGNLIGPNDMMIAAIARSRDLTLVSHNLAEFGRIPGLRLESWQAA